MGIFGLFKQESAGSGSSEPGQFGPYYLQELINSGGMADIWLATNEQRETLAVRRLNPALRGDSVARKRFQRGCDVLSRIHNHEFVIGYIDHGKIDVDLYCAMEYMEASNIKQLIARVDPILSEYLCNILIDAAIALEHVHDSGFMHMDFKPENILVSRNGNVRLVDFDLSLPRPDKPAKLSDNPGTPAYMAPEQLRRREVDHRADIFAFGVTAYELLTLQKPFPGETPKEVLLKMIEDRDKSFIPPREVNADIPFAVEKAILRCLDRDPAKRYPDMSVLVHELQTALYV